MKDTSPKETNRWQRSVLHDRSHVIRELQIIIRSYYYRFIRMVKIQNTNSTKFWQGRSATGTLIHCAWEYKMVQSRGNVFRGLAISYKPKHPRTCDPAITFLSISPNELQMYAHTKTCPQMFKQIYS